MGPTCFFFLNDVMLDYGLKWTTHNRKNVKLKSLWQTKASFVGFFFFELLSKLKMILFPGGFVVSIRF